MSNLRQLSEQEYLRLKKGLLRKGEVFFPLGTVRLGAICGSIMRMRRLGSTYSPRFRDRLILGFSESHRCITAFVWRFGPNDIDFEATYKDGRQGLLIRLKNVTENNVQHVGIEE